MGIKGGYSLSYLVWIEYVIEVGLWQ